MARPRTLAGAAQTGDRAETLRVLRDRLARQIDSTDSARDVAALSKQLTDVLAMIEAIPAPAEGTPLDELRKRRAARQSAAARSARAAGEHK